MNTKATKFQSFLKEQQIKVFEMEELTDDFNSVIFRSRMEVEGQLLPTVIIIDDSIYPLVRVQVVDKAIKGKAREVMLDYINELNAKYKVFKYYVTTEGALILDSCIPAHPDNFDGEMIRVVLDVILKHLIEEYPILMKKIWGEAELPN